MKPILSTVAVLALAGSVAVASMKLGEGGPPAAAGGDYALGSAKPAGGASSFRLAVAGREATCSVSKGKAVAAAAAELEIAGNCLSLLPDLSDARYWREADDGTIVFADEDGEAVVEFYGADGVAYESFRPATPLISMIVVNRTEKRPD